MGLKLSGLPGRGLPSDRRGVRRAVRLPAPMATRPPVELSSAERKSLRRLAHDLRPVVHIGEEGLTPRVVRALDEALEDHELVKLKINHEREERRELADEAARETGSALAGSVGRIAILFRPASDPERRRIDPRRGVRREAATD